MDMEAEKFHHVSSASQRTSKAGSITQPESKDLRTRGAVVWAMEGRWGGSRSKSWSLKV